VNGCVVIYFHATAAVNADNAVMLVDAKTEIAFAFDATPLLSFFCRAWCLRRR
jgi:hypothetical protein